MKPFISWGPDPAALAINAFTKNWSKWLIYAFPHTAESTFQVAERRGRRILTAPEWPTAVWYPQIWKMLTREPVLLPRGKRTISLLHREAAHPLHKKLQLLACVLSANCLKQEEFKVRLSKLFGHPGNNQQDSSMPPTSPDGTSSAFKASVIPFVHLEIWCCSSWPHYMKKA